MESGCRGSPFIVSRHLRKFAIESIALCAPSYLKMTSHFKSIPTPSGSQPDVWHLLLIFRGGQKLTLLCCTWKRISVPILRSVYIIFKASNWTEVPLSTPAVIRASLQSNRSEFALHPSNLNMISHFASRKYMCTFVADMRCLGKNCHSPVALRGVKTLIALALSHHIAKDLCGISYVTIIST